MARGGHSTQLRGVIGSYLSHLKPASRIAIVFGGYILAFVIAAFVLRIYIAATGGPDRQASSGMTAFGDSMFFVGVLGLAAVPATAAALYFLRGRRLFWVALSTIALLIAMTAIVAVVLSVGSASAAAGGRLSSWFMIAPLRILIAPVLALFWVLAGVFAPTRGLRFALLGAFAVEMMAFVSVAVMWWGSTR